MQAAEYTAGQLVTYRLQTQTGDVGLSAMVVETTARRVIIRYEHPWRGTVVSKVRPYRVEAA